MARTGGYGAKDDAGNFYFKAMGDGEFLLGNSADDSVTITGSLAVNGPATFNDGSIAADFRVESNNSENMFFIDGTNDRIGIDTATPAALLHISSSSPGVLFRIDHPDSGVDNPIFFVTGSSGTSKVGIGTETPDATFAISDDGKAFEVGSADETSWFEVNNGVIYFNAGGGYANSGGTFLGQRFNIAPINGTYGALGIGKYPGSTVNIVEVNSENSDQGGDFFVINSSGKVGIGKTSPTHALHVANGGPSSLYLEADTDNVDEDDTSYIKFTQDGGNTGTVLGLCPNSASKDPEGTAYTGALGSSFLVGTTTSTPIQFGTNDNVRMTIKQAGNVGIGTTNPSHLLEVDGTIKGDYYVTAPTATDLGSGTSASLTPSTSLHFLDADSVTLGSGKDYFEITLADGTTAGQHLQLAITNTPNNPVKIMGDTGGSKASATITFTGTPATGEALTVTDTDSNTYTVTYSDAVSCGSVVVAGERAITAGVFGCTTAADGAGQLYAAFDTGIGNGWPFTVASFSWGVDTEVTLTQTAAGTAGNNTISENLSNASATGFSGGTALVEGSINSTYGVALSNAAGATQGAHFVWDATSGQWQIIAGTQLTS